MRCSKGEIERSGYQRRGYVRNGKQIKPIYVEPACIKDVGVPGKGVEPTVASLRRGKIPAIGYNVDQPASYRHAAIARGVERYGRDMMQWRLEWEGTWRSRAPSGAQLDQSRRLLDDAKWLAKATKRDLVIKPLQCPGRVRKAFTLKRDGKRIAIPETCLA